MQWGGAAEKEARGGGEKAGSAFLQGGNDLDEVLNEVEDFLSLLEQRADSGPALGGGRRSPTGSPKPEGFRVPPPAPIVVLPTKPTAAKPPRSPTRSPKHGRNGFPSAPPRGEDRVVMYTTSVRAVRKTFEDCHTVRAIFAGHGVAVDERDISMHGEFREELRAVMGGVVPVPRVFIRGKYIGGVEDIQRCAPASFLCNSFYSISVLSEGDRLSVPAV